MNEYHRLSDDVLADLRSLQDELTSYRSERVSLFRALMALVEQIRAHIADVQSGPCEVNDSICLVNVQQWVDELAAMCPQSWADEGGWTDARIEAHAKALAALCDAEKRAKRT